MIRYFSEHYHVVSDAMEEVEKFERLLPSSAWRTALTTAHENILHTTFLESEIKSDAGNSFTILQPLLAE